MEKLIKIINDFKEKKIVVIGDLMYRKKCNCRKPRIGMLLQAVKNFNINLNKSWMIGDDVRDIIMGRETNVRTIKVGRKMPKELKLEPNYYARNLLQALKIIQKYEK